jgi:hypothetical protein
MNAPTFVSTMLAMLSQGAEVPEGDGWLPESPLGQLGDATYLFNCRAMRSIQ